MNSNPTNVILLLILILLAAGALPVYISPGALYWLVARLYARAHALTEARLVYKREYSRAMREGYSA